MTDTLTVESTIHFARAGRRKQLRQGDGPPPVEAGRVPRVSKLMALALKLDALVASGQVQSYAELAALGRVTRARVSQILSLVHLAPDLQEAVLFLPRTRRGRDPVILRQLLPIAATLDWARQRRMWQRLVARASR